MTTAPRRPQPTLRWGTLAVTVGGLIAVSACSSDSSEEPPKDPSSSASKPAQATSTPPDPRSAAKAEVVKAYEQYWRQMELLYADPKGKDAKLTDVAASAALKNAQNDAKRMHRGGNIIKGNVTIDSSTVQNLDLDRKIPNATLSTCLDVTDWKVIDRSTGKPAPLPSKRLTRYEIVSTIEKWPEGWRVIRDEPQGEKC